MKRLIVVSADKPTAADQSLLKLAACMGVPCKDGVVAVADLAGQSLPSQLCLVVTADTLAAALENPAGRAGFEKLLENQSTDLLVVNCNDPSRHATAVSWLAGGRCRLTLLGGDKANHAFGFPSSQRQFSSQFSGLTFSLARSASLPAFELNAADASVKTIINIDDYGYFVLFERAQSRIFLLAGSAVPDVDQTVSAPAGIREYRQQLIPLLIFFRNCFGKSCWHGPNPTARLIIDDPLLKERYGFLQYGRLLQSMRQHKYGTSIAFIPWNYRRTSTSLASSLHREGSNLSICVHGCDHTKREFENLDQEMLSAIGNLALRRMHRHQQRTGLPFEDVMVFPQGRFSRAAIASLRANNYLAAVNSTCFPADGMNQLTIADFLRPAVMRFEGFPIFPRYYPRDLLDFAFAMFLGAPALIVEHHGFFSDDCRRMENLVGRLREIEPVLLWPSLSTQLTQSCVMRYLAEESIEVQFFTRRFRFTNSAVQTRRLLLSKFEPNPSVVQSVLVNRQPAPFSVSENFLHFEIEAGPGTTIDTEIVDQPRAALRRYSFGMRYKTGVLLRRRLSEFRDNTLAKYPSLLMAATHMARALNLTAR